MRLIDADNLMSEIEGELEVDIVYEDRFINQGLKIALKDIKKQPTVDAATIIQSSWISVKEKLPEYDKSVLICYSKQQDITIAWLAEDIECFEDDDCMYYMSEVTHWMPLPEPPEPRKEV